MSLNIEITSDDACEVVVGSISKELYDYWTEQGAEEAVASCLYEAAEEHPEEFSLEEWFEKDNVMHISGANVEQSTIVIRDDDFEIIHECSTDAVDEDGELIFEQVGDRCFLELSAPKDKYFIIVMKHYSGNHFTGEVEADEFDPAKLTFLTSCVGSTRVGGEYITDVKYDGIEVENDGDVFEDFEYLEVCFIKT